MTTFEGASTAEYVPVHGFPKGADLSVLYGDPGKGAFEMYFRLQPGTKVPMHFHTSAERAIGIQGTIPWKKPHEAICAADGPACIAYFYLDRLST